MFVCLILGVTAVSFGLIFWINSRRIARGEEPFGRACVGDDSEFNIEGMDEAAYFETGCLCDDRFGGGDSD